MGEDPSIFATALVTLAVKAFGDMGQAVLLRLICDRFIIIAGFSSCELRRYLDSVPPETPIRDVVDRCHIWESHADPAVRWVSKPSPDPIYPTYVVGDSDSISEMTRVAAVTGLRSGPDQLEDLLRRLLMAVDTQTPIPEVPPYEYSGVGGIRADVTVVPLWPAGTWPPPRQRPIRRDWNGLVCFSVPKLG